MIKLNLTVCLMNLKKCSTDEKQMILKNLKQKIEIFKFNFKLGKSIR